jgi:hypothetical protein
MKDGETGLVAQPFSRVGPELSGLGKRHESLVISEYPGRSRW